MTSTEIRKVDGNQNSPIVLLARIEGLDGDLVTQESIESIEYFVYEYATDPNTESTTSGTEVEAAEDQTLEMTEVIFDTPRTDYGWESDLGGYNFRFTLPKAGLPNGRKFYRVEVWFTPVVGEEFLGAYYSIESKPVARPVS